MTQLIRVPGKFFLAGEYAVLLGIPALLMTIPVWSYAAYEPYEQVAKPIYPGATHEFATSSQINTSDFFYGAEKRGLGSSAAAALLMAARTGSNPQELWAKAKTQHQAIKGKVGSGADIAAMIHGGIGIFQATECGYAWTPCQLDQQAAFVFIHAQNSSDTSDWVQKFMDQTQQTDVQQWCESVRHAMFALLEHKHIDQTFFVQAAQVYSELQQWLGEDLYPDLFRQAAAMARELHIPFKPSGAGGGDYGFFYCQNRAEQQSLQTLLKKHNIQSKTYRPTEVGLNRTFRTSWRMMS